MRLVHKATDSLSAEAHRIMVSGFRARKTYRAIVRDIAEQTGEKVAERTVARRGIEFRAEESRRQAAREQVAALVEAMRDQKLNAAEMLQALAVDALLSDPQAWAGRDPLRVQAQNLRAEEIRLRREEVELRRRQVELDQQKFAALQERERRAIAEAEALESAAAGGKQITAEDLRRIREIYGLN